MHPSSEPGAAPPLPDEAIVVTGARVHNLKNISVTIPRNALTVITGPSGSGKSSLAFDTIYAEGQRRYIESLSVYARQFIDQLEKPAVESVTGLSPSISIDQKTTSYNPRSTVGTVTEVYDYLRLLFSRVAKPFCWNCNRPIESQSHQQIVDRLLCLPSETRISLLAPIVRGRKGEYQSVLLQLRQRGFVRARVDGEVFDLSDEIVLDRNKKHDIEVYVDRLVIKDSPDTLAPRLSESVELALKLGEGQMLLESVEKGRAAQEVLLSEKFACSHCDISYPEPEPRAFSFNSPAGACPACDGLGSEPIEPLAEDHPEAVAKPPVPCPACLGARLRRESLSYRLNGMNIAQVSALNIAELRAFLAGVTLEDRQAVIARRILKEIIDRLAFMDRVGVGYLSLDRPALTLSGGESQRIRLATQIGSALVGVIYVLDEPSIGLHPRDHSRLIDTLLELRDMGNTVLVVEHDRETMERADWIVDLGPGAGHRGGEVIAAGTVEHVTRGGAGVTSQYLAGRSALPRNPAGRRRPVGPNLRIEGAHRNNLKDVSVDFPLGVFTCVTGVSGSGKSTLIVDTLYPALKSAVYGVDPGDLKVGEIRGAENIDKVVDIDQSPIGRTPRSNPATYTDIYGLIRDLYSSLPESQVRGYKPGRFSFNVSGGRCEDCEGGGSKRVEMHFLADVYVTCDSCRGRRYNRETLEILYKGKNVADVLEMTAEEAAAFFSAVPVLNERLRVLCEVGLGYIHLGQSSTTLSGGEAQRIKLSRELSRRSTGKSVFILDEPSTGLHFDDIRKLVAILQQLVSQGNTVIVIEHNLDIVAAADHVIDMGPEGGNAGGYVVAQGTPEQIAAAPSSHTARFLKPYL
ncbi:MAG: excinuclease ABC subunit UvrA [Bdellovibrionales bacterium]|nr:excinuclease ABC subunit UvrA [Bdellovibrionales bacterium]